MQVASGYIQRDVILAKMLAFVRKICNGQVEHITGK